MDVFQHFQGFKSDTEIIFWVISDKILWFRGSYFGITVKKDIWMHNYITKIYENVYFG